MPNIHNKNILKCALLPSMHFGFDNGLCWTHLMQERCMQGTLQVTKRAAALKTSLASTKPGKHTRTGSRSLSIANLSPFI